MNVATMVFVTLAVTASLCSGTALHAQESAACAQLTELECIGSSVCTLEQVAAHGKYRCREARGRCETGFRQAGEGDIKQQCESRPGCAFNPGNCYCPPNLNCFCGGGPPPQCVESGAQKIAR